MRILDRLELLWLYDCDFVNLSMVFVSQVGEKDINPLYSGFIARLELERSYIQNFDAMGVSSWLCVWPLKLETIFGVLD